MTAETKLSLHRKLAQIMYEADRIPKNGTAPREMGGYKFVQVGDAADYIRKALAEKVITMIPTGVQVVGQTDRQTAKGGTMTTVDLITTWTLTDGETGESITIQSFGAGADVGDKYSGKASTSAMKYALLTGFLLSTGEDSEASNPEGAGGTATTPNAPASTPPKATEPVEELLGKLTKGGTVRKGGADQFKLEARQTPTGYGIGFRLEVDGDKAIPQVWVDGELGTALYMATEGDPEKLAGKHAKVSGRLFAVKSPGRQTYYRLYATAIETADFKIPAEDGDVPTGEPPAEAESVPLFDDAEQAKIDAALDKATAA